MSTHLLRRVTVSSRASSIVRARHHAKQPFAARLQSTSSPPPSASRAGYSTLTILSAGATLSICAYALGAVFPPPPATLLFPRLAPAPPSDPDSPESRAYTADLEAELQSLPMLSELRSREDKDQWYEARPYRTFPEERRVNNLTAGALRGPGKLALAPLIRSKNDESEAYAWIHLGRGLCGHDGIVHGGLLATLLDETLARTAISNLPDKVGVTANLSLNYRAPTRANQFVVIKTKLDSVKGRKTVVSGTLEDLDGCVLVQATATFVQPKYAKLLNADVLKHAMGEPTTHHGKDPHPEPVLLADGDPAKIDPKHFRK
ncbi:hypothetical protein HGRIS_003060 [Hohenbuehelia grisea]|uniref:Thioesterase domain-containing protein n=1 Tax=Hohenbuehelia grisea TaxID=104357 RepID=A0ABR3JMB7_9AGAR